MFQVLIIIFVMGKVQSVSNLLVTSRDFW